MGCTESTRHTPGRAVAVLQQTWQQRGHRGFAAADAQVPPGCIGPPPCCRLLAVEDMTTQSNCLETLGQLRSHLQSQAALQQPGDGQHNPYSISHISLPLGQPAGGGAQHRR